MEVCTSLEVRFGIASIYNTPSFKAGLVEGHVVSLGCLG